MSVLQSPKQPPRPRTRPRPGVGAILLVSGNLGLVVLNWWLWARR